MTFYRSLHWKAKDLRILFRNVRDLKALDWNTTRTPIVNLRTRLLHLQNGRCAYCQAAILRDEVGYRDIDHILPKEPSKNPDAAKALSNNLAHRRITNGYRLFRHEPRNLVVSCKMCNSSKGTYDALRNRSNGYARPQYPKSSQIDWMNPHFMDYFDHIAIDENFLYSIVNHSVAGAAVLKECKLCHPDVLAKKFRPHALFEAGRSGNLEACTYKLRDGVNDKLFGKRHAEFALVAVRGLTDREAERLMSMCLNKDENVASNVPALCAQLEAQAATVNISFLQAVK